MNQLNNEYGPFMLHTGLIPFNRPLGAVVFLTFMHSFTLVASIAIKDAKGTNVPILHRIWIHFQGAPMGAC